MGIGRTQGIFTGIEKQPSRHAHTVETAGANPAPGICLSGLLFLEATVANRYFVNGGVDNNWGTIGNWSLTDGGTGGQAVPTTSDAVFFTSNSPNCTVNTQDRVAGTLNTTGYTNTITKTFRITVSGAITLSSGTNWAGAEYLTAGASATLTANSCVVDKLWLTGASVFTVADNWSCGTLRVGTTSTTLTVNGSQISISGDADFSQLTTGSVLGTTLLLMTGTGSVLPTTSTGAVRVPVTINTSGTVTFAAGTFRYGSSTFTYSSGTVDATGCDFACTLVATLALGAAVKWKSVTLQGSVTYTLSADLWSLGSVSMGTGSNNMTLNGSKLYVGGGLTNAGTTSRQAGTTEIVLNGTGTVSSSSTGICSNNITINTAGTITITSLSSTAFNGALGGLKYVAGTVITDAGTWTAVGGGGGSVAFSPFNSPVIRGVA